MPQARVTTEWILDRFDDIYPAHRIGFARLLVTLRRDFGGDLDAMLVLLTLSLGTDRTDWAQTLFVAYAPVRQTRLTNTQSIAQATGIPRETVRRKLEAMQARGWVRRDEAGNWSPTDVAVRDLRDSSRETIGFIRGIVEAALKADVGDAATRPPTEG